MVFLKYKQIGVIGALMIIKCMSMRAKIDKTTENEIKHIWEMIMESSRSSPESLGLFEDDLTSLLRKDMIPESVEKLIKENLKEITKSLFTLDTRYQEKLSFFNDKLASFKINYEFGLDTHSNGSLNLITQLMSDFLKKNSSLLMHKLNISGGEHNLPPITIPSTFRLMAAFERKNPQVELKE